MEVDNEADAVPTEEVDPPFLQLPEEMFLYICSFLDVTDIVVSLSRVCSKFNSILQSENIWKSWVAARWGRHYPIAEVKEEKINWKEACYSLEKDYKAWSSGLKKVVVPDAHLADVDAVLFLNEGSTCVTSSRDRNIIIWNLDQEKPTVVSKKYAHEGWVWRLRWFDDTLYSASWDNTIKLWSLQSELEQKQQFRCNSAVLSINLDENGMLYGGGFKHVYAFDPRAQNEPIYSLAAAKPVLTLDLLDENLIVGSESKTLAVWDKRQRTLKQTVKLPGASFPTTSQLLRRTLYVGDRDGNVRLYAMEDGTLTELAVVDVGHTKTIAAIKVLPGSIVTGSASTVLAVMPVKPSLHIATFHAEGGPVSGMDCCNGKLAIGAANAIEFWLPTASN